jgi:hypothetical protein
MVVKGTIVFVILSLFAALGLAQYGLPGSYQAPVPMLSDDCSGATDLKSSNASRIRLGLPLLTGRCSGDYGQLVIDCANAKLAEGARRSSCAMKYQYAAALNANAVRWYNAMGMFSITYELPMPSPPLLLPTSSAEDAAFASKASAYPFTYPMSAGGAMAPAMGSMPSTPSPLRQSICRSCEKARQDACRYRDASWISDTFKPYWAAQCASDCSRYCQ